MKIYKNNTLEPSLTHRSKLKTNFFNILPNKTITLYALFSKDF